ncbi:MAG TPA: SdrD B-like domain-containing protein, partial [Acidimicrobiia bacterium]
DISDDFTPTFTGGDTNTDGLLDTDETWLYEETGTAEEGSYANFADVTGISATEVELRDNDPSHYFGVTSGVTIEKSTNSIDADTPTGPVLRVGDLVHWTYVVTNTGNFPIAGWTVVDDIIGTVGCPRIVLLPERPVTCFATGTVEEGQYANVGTVNATDVLDEPLTAEDPSHYLGIAPAIELVKFTNDEDANVPTGPVIALGGGVTWTYEVTNTGTAALNALTVIDPRLGGNALVDCDATQLDPGESTTCTATGAAELGQYENSATAIAFDQFLQPVSSADPSHYFGAQSGISLFKYTDGVDANEPPGPNIPEGDPVVWTFDVVNTGNTAVSGIVLVDDQLGPITCPLDTLGVGEEMRCTATGTAERGQYANTATVTGVDEAGTTVSGEDPSHYFGFIVEVDIEKFTNGEDADEPTGPQIPVGEPVTWTYEVTNPGDFPLADVVVTDDQGVTPVFVSGDTNGDDVLDPGETWLYEATGTAEVGQYANVATADGLADVEEGIPVSDSDPSHYIGVDEGLAFASLGDTVWLDDNRNGIRDAGEVGIPEALVTVDFAAAATSALAATIQAIAVPVTVATGPDGDYLVAGLVAGDYVVTLDLASVDSALALTTPESYSVTLQVGENFLDADFGLAQPPIPLPPEPELPATGSDMDQLAWLGLVMLLIGAAVLVADRRRRGSVDG